MPAARLAATARPKEPELLAAIDQRAQPRIPFGWLVERGLLQPGDVLCDQHRRHTARVAADGTIVAAEVRGSIHRVGAHVQNAPACNGWQFWFAQKGSELVPIDVYRQQLRAELN